MKCPKCGTLLFRRKKEYYCIGCSLYGTYPQMQKKLQSLNRLFCESLARVTCKFCKTKVPLSKLGARSYKGKSMFICKDCLKKLKERKNV